MVEDVYKNDVNKVVIERETNSYQTFFDDNLKKMFRLFIVRVFIKIQSLETR